VPATKGGKGIAHIATVSSTERKGYMLTAGMDMSNPSSTSTIPPIRCHRHATAALAQTGNAKQAAITKDPVPHTGACSCGAQSKQWKTPTKPAEK
jgi:hypothetical protein